VSDFEGLDESDYWSRNGLSDHWKGSYTRGSPKGRIEVAWNHVSPSQIENYSKCPRSWYFKSILKVPEKQKGHQTLGEAFHLIMEKVPQGLSWPNHADVDASPEDWEKAEAMAKQALPLLPVSDKIEREAGFRLPTYENGPTMIGYLDLGIPNGIGWPSLLIPTNEAIVGDYKTLSDFRYMKTPQELADSIQMMTYAKWAIEPWPSGFHRESDIIPDTVRLLHLYARTKPPFTRASIRHESALVSHEEINTRWEKTLDIVREMQQVSACTNSDDVEARGALNGHCEAYGGCTFRDKCGIAKSSGIKTLFQITKKPQEQVPMGSAILEKIKAAQAAVKAANATQSPTTPVASAANTSASPGTIDNSAVKPAESETVNPSIQPTSAVSNVAKGPVSGLLAKIKATGKGRPHLTGAIAQAYGKEQGMPLVTLLGDGELAHTTVASLTDLLKLASGIVPPDAPSRSQPVITRPGDAVVDPIKVMEPEGDEIDGDEDGSSTVDVSNVPDVASSSNHASTGSNTSSAGSALASDVVKKRGRPSKEEMAAREAAAKKAFDDAVAVEVLKRMGNNTNASEALNDQAKDINALQAELSAKDKEIAELRGISEQGLLVGKAAEVLNALRLDNEDLKRQLKTQPTTEGLTLYVDCFPTKGDREVTDFFEWIGPICAQVAQQNSVGDWRQINYTAKGLLANAIRETIREHGTPKAMTLSTYAGGADIALEILTPIAKRVIKKL